MRKQRRPGGCRGPDRSADNMGNPTDDRKDHRSYAAWMKARRIFAVAVIVAAITALVSTNAYASSGHFTLNKVKHATAKFKSLPVAQNAGYGLLVDKNGISCIDMQPEGAMG